MSDKIKAALLNPQGHVKWKNPPIASHPDTGGQIVYILELSKELARLGCKVDILTRYFDDSKWPGYNRRIEKYENDEDLRIVRIKFGDEGRFINKEDLWPLMLEYTKGVEEFYEDEGYSPDVFTSHYADGGLAAAILKKSMNRNFTHTGHSLGGKKMDNLKMSKSNFSEINSEFNFHLRIAAERVSFRNARAIVVSTQEEIDKQYGHRVYSGAVRNGEKFEKIPPGIDRKQFFSFREKEDNTEHYDKAVDKLKGELKKSISKERLDYPCIFSAARFDAKKNPAGLLKSYASSPLLREKFNILIVAGNVEDPLDSDNRNKFDENEKMIIDELVSEINHKNLQGNVAFSPGFDFLKEMPYVYRYAARNGWVFVNPALHEPFGLTIVEAMGSGLPVVATKHGGPSEILSDGKYGILADSRDENELRKSMEKLTDESLWEEFSKKGEQRVRERFTWKSAASSYIKLFRRVKNGGFSQDGDLQIPGYFLKPSKEKDALLKTELKKLYLK